MDRFVPRLLVLAISGAAACRGIEFAPGDESSAPPAVGDTPPSGSTFVPERTNPPPDAVPEDGGEPSADAGDGGPSGACDPSSPFDRIELEPGINSPGDEVSFSIVPGGSQAYVGRSTARDAAYGRAIFVSAKSGTGFGPPQPMPALDIPGVIHDNVTTTPSGDRVYVETDRANGLYQIGIYTATRAPNGSIGTLTPVPALDLQVSNEVDPYLQGNGGSLYFSVDVNRANAFDLFVATLAPDGGVTRTAALTELNTSGAEHSPVVSKDGLVLYFARGAASHSTDVFLATRTSTSAPFSNVRKVAELSTDYNDYPAWVSEDLCTLYFVSNGRVGGLGMHDIFRATRSRK